VGGVSEYLSGRRASPLPVPVPPEPPRRLIAVVHNTTDGMRTAEYAGNLAATLHAPVTVALVLRPPPALALAATAFIAMYYPLDDVEIDVMLHLSRVFDGLGISWRLEALTGGLLPAAVARLAGAESTCWVLVGRPWQPWPRHTPRLARTLRRRYGLPVLVVPAGGDAHRRGLAT
jgi:hypothetical protein